MKKILASALKVVLYIFGFILLLALLYILGAKNVESLTGGLVILWLLYQMISWVFKKISLGWRRATYNEMEGTFLTSTLQRVKKNKSDVYKGESVSCPHCNSTIALWGSGGGAMIIRENHKKYCPHCHTRIKISGDPWDEN